MMKELDIYIIMYVMTQRARLTLFAGMPVVAVETLMVSILTILSPIHPLSCLHLCLNNASDNDNALVRAFLKRSPAEKKT